LEEVQSVLEKLSDETMPFVKQLPRQAGQKEARYIHLMGEYREIPDEPEAQHQHSGKISYSALEERVTILEQELATMKEAFDKLMKELMG
jgi:uncharacterized protein YceH (UPF0502 family)